MIKNIKIDGMHCMHCVASVKSALQAIDGVSEVNVSLDDALATVNCDDTVTDESLKSAIENIGFDVL